MTPALDTVLTYAALLGACMWLGGFAVVMLVVHVARRELDPTAQIRFFRALGRCYLGIGASLGLVLGAGLTLLSLRHWTGVSLPAVLASGALVLAVAAGVVQARATTRARQRAIEESDHPKVSRG